METSAKNLLNEQPCNTPPTTKPAGAQCPGFFMPMTKQQEIDALNRIADSLPHDSYLADWLLHVAPQIANDIRNDIFPTVLPETARKVADEIIAKANADATSIIVKAEAKASAIIATETSRQSFRRSQFTRAEQESYSAARKLIAAMEELPTP